MSWKRPNPIVATTIALEWNVVNHRPAKKKLKSESAISITITLYCDWDWYLKLIITITYTRDQVSLSLVLATNYHYHWQERPQKTWELSDAKIRSASLALAQFDCWKSQQGSDNSEWKWFPWTWKHIWQQLVRPGRGTGDSKVALFLTIIQRNQCLSIAYIHLLRATIHNGDKSCHL